MIAYGNLSLNDWLIIKKDTLQIYWFEITVKYKETIYIKVLWLRERYKIMSLVWS